MSTEEGRDPVPATPESEEAETGAASAAPPDETPNPESTRLAPGLGILIGIVLGVLGFFAWERLSPAFFAEDDMVGHEDHDTEVEEVWTCPMHPSVISDSPGACPVCFMDLVLRQNQTGRDPVELARLGRVAISPVERVLANVAPVPVGRTDLVSDLRAFGRVVYDETSYATIPAWVGGRVEELYVEETGTEVERGQRLLSIYSPQLLAAQEEYLVILNSGTYSEGLVEPAERRLRLLGMSRRQIRRLSERGQTTDTITVYAPAAGTVIERLVQDGQYVREGQPLVRLAGMQNMWVEADVFERDVPFVADGMQVDLTFTAFPSETFSGIVTLVWPFLDTDTRTLRVRIEFEDPDARFRPGMYATVRFSAVVAENVVVVPSEAVIRTGERNAVYVEIEDNLFERRLVEIGYRSGDLIEIRNGVSEGEQVVARGGFLIDSEAQLYAGGQSLHHGHVAEEQGTTSLERSQAFDALAVGDFFCPTDPRQQGDSSGRCSDNNMPFVQREAHTHFEPHADPVTLVHEGDWYCPMGAEWVADEAGRCPICNMNLVEMSSEAPAEEASSQRAQAGDTSAALSDVPIGHYFCPTEPSEHSAESARCESNGMQMLQHTEGLSFDPNADPLSFVQHGEWYCPMGAEWVAEEEGRCPICGMFLIEMEGHEHGGEAP